jgi:N-acetylglucosaminyldiphosphoundecaprenol N-acetyl-beta-D-mannosaminyltransferase
MKRHDILGVGVSAVNLGLAFEEIARWIEAGERHYVCVTGVHGIMESRRDPELRRIHNSAGLVTPDGMPLVWILKRAGLAYVDRVYGPDLMEEVSSRGRGRGIRHFMYGASEAALERLEAALRARHPGIEIVGSLSPPYRPLTEAEDDEIVRIINDAAPNIVWVGLSTPKQERWMATHVDRLSANALIGVGAAFDLCSGMVRQAPRFVQRSGMEWAFRLAMEPRRLWKRYLTNNPLFLLHLVRERLAGDATHPRKA